MPDEEAPSIRVNFGKPMPLFPLDGVALLPHAVLPLHIFEPRYRQMVEDSLDGSGQIALAVFEGERWKQEYHGRPPLRPGVCIAHILQHEKLPDGRYNILVQGVCRARIDEELSAAEQAALAAGAPGPTLTSHHASGQPGGERLYREARLAPVGLSRENEDELAEQRDRLRSLLRSAPLRRFTDAQDHSLAEGLATYLDRPPHEIPTSVVVDLIGHLMVKEPKVKYMLLAEGEPAERARVVEHELGHLASLIRRADLQVDPKAPKGAHWN